MVWGEHGERDPHSPQEEGTGWESSGCHRKSRSHMSPPWHSAGRGCHSTTPPKVGGPPTLPQLNALPGSASCTGLAPVRRATCQNHFLNQTTTGGGTATRGPRAPDRALPLLPNSGRAHRACTPKAPRVHGRGSQPEAASGGCTASVNPESTPRSQPELSAPVCRATPQTRTQHLQLPPSKPPENTHPEHTEYPPNLRDAPQTPPGGIPLPPRLLRGLGWHSKLWCPKSPCLGSDKAGTPKHSPASHISPHPASPRGEGETPRVREWQQEERGGIQAPQNTAEPCQSSLFPPLPFFPDPKTFYKALEESKFTPKSPLAAAGWGRTKGSPRVGGDPGGRPRSGGRGSAGGWQQHRSVPYLVSNREVVSTQT